MSAHALYPFQSAGLAAARACFKRPRLEDGKPVLRPDGRPELQGAVLIVGPTGMGKTVVACEVALGVFRRHATEDGGTTAIVVFVVHTRELRKQGHDKIVAYAKSNGVRLRSDNLKVMMIQDLERKYAGQAPDVLLIDEAHHYVSPNYLAKIRAFQDAGTKVIGFTATPYRHDKIPLGRANGGIFDDMVVFAQVPDLVALNAAEPDRGIVPIDVWAPPVGSINAKDREIAMSPVKAYALHGGDRSAVVFVDDVDEAVDLVAEFKASGIESVGMVCSNKKRMTELGLDRDKVTSSFASGELRVLVNVACLTEGWDAPICEVVILARSVGSLSLLVQMIGRGRRPKYAGKRCLLIDLGASLETHEYHPDCLFEYTLDGEPRPLPKEHDPKPRICPDCGEDLTDAYELAKEEGEPLRTCPVCKHALWKPRRAKTRAEVALEKVVLGDARRVKAAEEKSDKRRAWLVQKYIECIEKGYKAGWVIHRYEARFKHVPPAAWQRPALEEAKRILSTRSNGHDDQGDGRGEGHAQDGGAVG